jgi:hypothetical protein
MVFLCEISNAVTKIQPRLDADVILLPEHDFLITPDLGELSQVVNSSAERFNVREKNLNAGRAELAIMPDQLRVALPEITHMSKWPKNITQIHLSDSTRQAHDFQEQLSTVTPYEHRMEQL